MPISPIKLKLKDLRASFFADSGSILDLEIPRNKWVKLTPTPSAMPRKWRTKNTSYMILGFRVNYHRLFIINQLIKQTIIEEVYHIPIFARN